MRHVVWDWNGTLFDDLHIVIESVNVALLQYGGTPIDEDTYRALFVRPVSLFYEQLLGRPISRHEWHDLDVAFHAAYTARLRRAGLSGDARTALDMVADSGSTQSLLSMFLHEDLVSLTRACGIDGYMARVEGLQGIRGDTKHDHLARHLVALGVEPGMAVVIGDALDDVAAARAVGAEAVLYDGGSHRHDRLEESGAPIAKTLPEAVSLALELVPPIGPEWHPPAGRAWSR